MAEITNLIRVGGCATKQNILGILFGETETELTVPIRILASCPKRNSSDCCIQHTLFGKERGCRRYRIGTKGSHRISWDKKNSRM